MIEKLKAAETEIKSLMVGANALRKQAASDQEVGTFFFAVLRDLIGGAPTISASNYYHSFQLTYHLLL